MNTHYRISASFIMLAWFLIGNHATLPRAAFAEGGEKRANKDFGLNRRVVTKTGYEQVEGNFSVVFRLPFHLDLVRGIQSWLGAYYDYPSVYLGGSGIFTGQNQVEVDAGLQYDQMPNDTGGYKGWGYFLRNSNDSTSGNADAQYVQPQFWDTSGTIPQSKTYKSGETFGIDAYLKYTVYQGDDASTPTLAEHPGWMSLAVDKLGDGLHTVYWTHPNIHTKVKAISNTGQNTIDIDNVIDMQVGGTITVGAETKTITNVARTTDINPDTHARDVWGTITMNSNFATNHPVGQIVEYEPSDSTDTFTTSVQSGGAIGTKTIVVASVAGIEDSIVITIGTEVKNISSINANTKTITVTTAFINNHATGENVTQELDCRRAYPNHPAAPWRGIEIFEPTKLDQTKVKRIVAMTRKTISEEIDGSMLRCTFKDGRVKKIGETSADGHLWGAGFPTGGGDFDDVLQSDNDATENKKTTGYDTAADDAPDNKAWDRRWPEPQKTTYSRTTMEFPNLSVVIGGQTITGAAANTEARKDTTASHRATENGNSRYTEETVRINLETAAHLEGESVERLK